MKPALSPPHWPFEQPHVLLTIQQREHALEQERLKTSTSIRDIDLQSSDDEGAGYSPSESSESEENDDEGEAEIIEHEGEAMDLDVGEEEVLDLTRDIEEKGWPSSPTPSEKDRFKEIKFQGELQILEAAEKEAAAIYNPNEVVELLTEFFELLAKIAHWPVGVIKKAPHTDPAVNTELAKELGYGPAVVELMQKLPYVNDEANRHGSLVVPDSYFYDYTQERYLKRAKKHIGYDKYGATIESWILPLVGPSNREGWSVVLDTRLGVIRAYAPMEGPRKSSIEYRQHGEEEGVEGPLAYYRAPLVPAAKYLRTLIECYRPLDRVPLMDAYHSDPDFAKGPHREGLNWYYENMEDEQRSILTLYKECGWPDQWNRSAFLDKWKVLQAQLQERGRERMKRDKALT